MRASPSSKPSNPTPRINSKHQNRGRRLPSILHKLFGCCGSSMGPGGEHEQAQPIRTEEATFDGLFVQLGPNDVSYKERSQPKMVHQYILGEVIGEGMDSSIYDNICVLINFFKCRVICKGERCSRLHHQQKSCNQDTRQKKAEKASCW